jgi:hypothetical protein
LPDDFRRDVVLGYAREVNDAAILFMGGGISPDRLSATQCNRIGDVAIHGDAKDIVRRIEIHDKAHRKLPKRTLVGRVPQLSWIFQRDLLAFTTSD